MAKLIWKGKNPPRWVQSLSWLLEAGMLRLLWLVVQPMSLARATATGHRFMRWLGPRLNKHKHVLANLRMACPEKTPQEIIRLGSEVWGNLGAVLAEFPHLDEVVDLERADPVFEIDCKNQDEDFLARSKPCIFIAAHLGNWEISSFCIKTIGYPVDVVYSPLENGHLERMVQQKRAVLGCSLIPKVNALRRMYKSLKSGRSVGLHVDVRVDDGGLFPLCGTDAMTTTAPAWLAQKTGYKIVPVVTKQLGDGRFRFTVHPAIDTSSNDIDQITIEMNRAIGTLIRQNPGQWLCTKRRWPKEEMRQLGVY